MGKAARERRKKQKKTQYQTWNKKKETKKKQKEIPVSVIAKEPAVPIEKTEKEAPIVPETITEKNEKRGGGKNMNGFTGFSLTLEGMICRNGGNGIVNAAYASNETGMSMSTHYPLFIKGYGKIIPIIIPPATEERRQGMKLLNKEEVGEWTKENVQNWEDGIYWGRIAHCNIISTENLDMSKPVKGLALVSAKETVQTKGRQVFHHLILIPEERVEPAFELSINSIPERDDDEVVVGPTIGALRNNKEIKEYLHLKACKQ